MIKALAAVIVCLFIYRIAFAGGGEAGGIPMGFIKLQLLNFAAFMGLVIYFGRKFLPPVMVNFKKDYLEKASAARARFEEAKRTKEDLEKKLKDLELTYEDTLKKARQEAEELRLSKVKKAEKQASLMDKDLTEQITALKRSYWLEVKTSLIQQAVEELKDEFKNKVDPTLLKKLQDEFVAKMSARVS